MSPSWSPDGQWIVYDHKDFAGSTNRIEWVRAEPGPQHSLEVPAATSLAWSPDGKWIATSEHLIVQGRPSQERILLVPADGSSWTEIGPGSNPTWSPDSQRIACAVLGPDGFEIDLMNRQGGERTRLTSGRNPCWSPDGSHLALVDFDDVQPDVVFSIALDGSKRTRLGPGFMPSWSPTGELVLFTRSPIADVPQTRTLMTIRPDGSDEHVLADGAIAGRFSPDGSKIAFLRGDFSYELFVVNADGSDERSLGKIEVARQQLASAR